MDDDQNQDFYARNAPYAVPHTLTQLNPPDERNFQEWVAANRVPFDPSPKADYDMRGFYRGLTSGDPRAVQAVNPNDNQMHFPDYWKTPYHQSFSAESQWAKPGAPSWNEKDQLVLPNGQIVFDERAQLHRADGGDTSDDVQPSSPLDQDRANFAQRVHQGLDQYLGGVNNLAPKSNEQAAEMALDATPIVGNVRSAQAGYEAAQNHDWLGAALGAVGAVPLLGGIIAGPAARTANHEALAIAKEMAANGASPERIYKGTRWWQGEDGKWRFEIPDDTSMMYIPKEGERPLGQTLHHPKLYEAYPDLADRPTHVGRFETETGQPLPNTVAGYDPDLDTLHLNSANPLNKHSPLLHEIQHAVQNREGFSPGSSARRFTPEEIAAERARLQALSEDKGWGSVGTYAGDITDKQIAQRLYQEAPGEREAREVQERMRLSPDERTDKPPYDVRKHKSLPKLPEFSGLTNETLDLLNSQKKYGGSISDGTRALLAKVKRQDGGQTSAPQSEADIPTIEPQPLWPKSLTPNLSGDTPPGQPDTSGNFVARPIGAPIANPLKDPQMNEALPYLTGAGVGRGAGALISRLYPDVAALGSKVLDYSAFVGVPYHIYEMANSLREPLSQAWNNGVMPSAEREQAMYDGLRQKTQKNFEQNPEGTVNEVKSMLQWQPDTPGGRVNRSEYLKGVPYSVLSRAYADLYPMPSDNAPNTTTVKKTAAITSGSSPAKLD